MHGFYHNAALQKVLVAAGFLAIMIPAMVHDDSFVEPYPGGWPGFFHWLQYGEKETVTFDQWRDLVQDQQRREDAAREEIHRLRAEMDVLKFGAIYAKQDSAIMADTAKWLVDGYINFGDKYTYNQIVGVRGDSVDLRWRLPNGKTKLKKTPALMDLARKEVNPDILIRVE